MRSRASRRYHFFLPFILCAITTLSACVSISVISDDDKKGGYIIYNPNGADEAVKQRKKDGLERIADFCPTGKYKVTKEIDRERKQDEGTDTLQGTLAVLGSSDVHEIAFRCL